MKSNGQWSSEMPRSPPTSASNSAWVFISAIVEESDGDLMGD
jgi:hypothetical protein